MLGETLKAPMPAVTKVTVAVVALGIVKIVPTASVGAGTAAVPPLNTPEAGVTVSVAAAFAVGALNEATRENNIVTVRIILRIFFIIMFRLLSSE
jgi:hypothetical protein